MTPAITSTFKAFSTGHILALVIIMGAAIVIPGFCRLGPLQRHRVNVARLLGVLLASAELIWYGYLYKFGELQLQESLPLHMCDISIWAVIFALFTRKRMLYEWSYFFGIGGGLQGLLTPELKESFPSLVTLKFFFSHGGIIVGVAYLTWAMGMRPHWKSIWRMVIVGNIYMVAVGLFNLAAGTNYGYLCRKPANPSLLDFLGPWPWYILSLEALSIAIMIVLYVPFAIRDRFFPRAEESVCPSPAT